MTAQSDALTTLRERYPWPDVADCTAWDYTLGGYGRQLIDMLISDSKPAIFLEIGCFLCASTRRWLSQDPTLVVIGVDPWGDTLVDQCRRYIGRPALTRAYPDMADQHRFLEDVTRQGPYRTALANVARYRDRFIPVRGTSPEKLYEIAEMGIVPDIIYIDADKKSEDLDVSHALWPDAHIAGDDWHWSRSKGYPMRKIVNGFAEKHGFNVVAEHATWLLER